MSNERLQQIEAQLQPARQALLTHPVYERIDSIESLQVFMEHHVFAVWDFMSLLKALQVKFCPCDTPWTPPANPLVARLVNDIVLAEETDEDGEGGFASHFALYRRAMQRCEADTDSVDRLLTALRNGDALDSAIQACGAPPAVTNFVCHTFQLIETGEDCEIAASFLFGREDLLPDVFQRIVSSLNLETDGTLDGFLYYLHRHIELDGDHHGPMAARMIQLLCGDDPRKWQAAERAAIGALEARRGLWDAIAVDIETMQRQLPIA